MKLHAGRYSSKKIAEEYASFLRSQGLDASLESATVYDIFVEVGS